MVISPTTHCITFKRRKLSFLALWFTSVTHTCTSVFEKIHTYKGVLIHPQSDMFINTYILVNEELDVTLSFIHVAHPHIYTEAEESSRGILIWPLLTLQLPNELRWSSPRTEFEDKWALEQPGALLGQQLVSSLIRALKSNWHSNLFHIWHLTEVSFFKKYGCERCIQKCNPRCLGHYGVVYH